MKKLLTFMTFVLVSVAALAVPSKALALESPTLHATYQGGDRVYVWWTPVADANYQLFYGPKENQWAHGVVLGQGTNYTVGALFRNTSYAFTVKAVRDGNVSASSNTVWVSVGSVGRTPVSASQPVVQTTNQGNLTLWGSPGTETGSVTLYWSGPPSGASSYNVVYTDDPSMEKWGATNLSGSLRSYTVSGLVSGRKYWFWMSTRDSGMTPWVTVVAR